MHGIKQLNCYFGLSASNHSRHWASSKLLSAFYLGALFRLRLETGGRCTFPVNEMDDEHLFPPVTQKLIWWSPACGPCQFPWMALWTICLSQLTWSAVSVRPQWPWDILGTITSVHNSSLKRCVVRSCCKMGDEFSITTLMVIIKISPLHRAVIHPLIWLHFDSAFRVQERWVRSYFIYISPDQIMIQTALPFST